MVGFPHELKGEGLYAFIILKNDVSVSEQEVKTALKALIRNNIAGYAVPDHMLVSFRILMILAMLMSHAEALVGEFV